MSTYVCSTERRRALVMAAVAINGIDFVDVRDDAVLQATNDRQRFLELHMLKADHLTTLTADNLRIVAGPTATIVNVVTVRLLDDSLIEIECDRAGDASVYTLSLVESVRLQRHGVPIGFDPMSSSLSFSFKVACPSDLDCADPCAPTVSVDDALDDYLARDYHGVRQVMLDRMSSTAPAWRDRSAADGMVAVVELLAVVADHLAYAQDAVATEAYLHTARHRTSVRRHARLVDYHMHDGCNARTWLHVAVDAATIVPEGTRVTTAVPGLLARVAPSDGRALTLMQTAEVVFETMTSVGPCRPEYNTMWLYTWGDRDCCLPAGATAATLRGPLPAQDPQSAPVVLCFEEFRSVRTGQTADADPQRRHCVRIHSWRDDVDIVTGQPIVHIAWHADDALPFPMTVSGITDDDASSTFFDDITVVRGNMVPADHGRRIDADENLDVVVSTSYRPRVAEGPLTQRSLLDHTSVVRSLRQQPAQAEPVVILRSVTPDGRAFLWRSRRDLLASRADDTHMVVEVANDGSATLRFGDDVHGRRPDLGERMTALYRVGNGAAGNVGADALCHVCSADAAILGVRNPLPAVGGVDSEDMETVRRAAPQAFRTQERCVTAADYAERAQRLPDIQRAQATMRWTGSWHTVFVTPDVRGASSMPADLRQRVSAYLEPFRMAGHDLAVDQPIYVGLRMTFVVCVARSHRRSDVSAAIMRCVNGDGVRPGMLHPDRFSFGQTVWLSPFLAAIQNVDGVDRVQCHLFERMDRPSDQGLVDGALTMARLEIPCCDTDARYPERGVFRLIMEGGR